jgi:hypothetical protein
MRIGIDPANRDVRISTHRNLTYVDPLGIEIHRLGKIGTHCMRMRVGIERANRDRSISTHRNIKHIGPHGNEIRRLGRQTVVGTVWYWGTF